MHTDSRKAQRDRYARHRADLMFSKYVASKRERAPWSAALHEGTEPAVLSLERVRAGLIGFVSATAVVGG